MTTIDQVNVGDRIRIDRYEYGAPAGEIVQVTGIDRNGNLLYRYDGIELQTGRGACSIAQWIPYGDPKLLD